AIAASREKPRARAVACSATSALRALSRTSSSSTVGCITLLQHGRDSASGSRDQEVAQHHGVHLCAQEALQRFARRTYYRFILVEAGIQNDRRARDLLERVDQFPISCVRLACDCLHPPRVVHVV